MEPIIPSILDTDLYKITMGQAVLHRYDGIEVKYKFINRGGTLFPRGFAEALRQQIRYLADLSLNDKELRYVRSKCYYLRDGYLDWLTGFRFNPDEVIVEQTGGDLSVTIIGPWYRTIYYEVPLLAIISELYYRVMEITPDEDFVVKAMSKGIDFQKNDVRFAEFGTRRRFSLSVQNDVLEALLSTAGKMEDGGVLNGTSNVYLAYMYNLTPIGTFAHEWVMAHSAIYGHRMATQMALQAWADEFDAYLGIALTDTFTTDVFWQNFGPRYAKLFDGVRQDSGDPITFADRFIAHLKSLRINPLHKSIVFSDALDVVRAIEINRYCKGKVGCSFGIGTHLTNDVGAKPLNMVIKLSEVKVNSRWIPVIKLSDSRDKATGDFRAIESARYELGI